MLAELIPAAISAPMTIVVAASVAIFTSLTAPTLLFYMTARQHTRDKRQDWARQDLVAKRVAEATEAAQEIAHAATAAQDLAATHLRKVGETVEVVHTLVNSDKTAAMQRELDDKRNALVMLREINRLQALAGGEPTEESLGAISATKSRIESLTAEMAERHKQGELALAQEKAHAAALATAPVSRPRPHRRDRSDRRKSSGRRIGDQPEGTQ
jgi:hypothetical protein